MLLSLPTMTFSGPKVLKTAQYWSDTLSISRLVAQRYVVRHKLPQKTIGEAFICLFNSVFGSSCVIMLTVVVFVWGALWMIAGGVRKL